MKRKDADAIITAYHALVTGEVRTIIVNSAEVTGREITEKDYLILYPFLHGEYTRGYTCFTSTDVGRIGYDYDGALGFSAWHGDGKVIVQTDHATYGEQFAFVLLWEVIFTLLSGDSYKRIKKDVLYSLTPAKERFYKEVKRKEASK